MKLTIVIGIARGLTVKQLAAICGVSEKAVAWHLIRIYQALGFPKTMNRIALLTRWAVTHGLA